MPAPHQALNDAGKQTEVLEHQAAGRFARNREVDYQYEVARARLQGEGIAPAKAGASVQQCSRDRLALSGGHHAACTGAGFARLHRPVHRMAGEVEQPVPITIANVPEVMRHMSEISRAAHGWRYWTARTASFAVKGLITVAIDIPLRYRHHAAGTRGSCCSDARCLLSIPDPCHSSSSCRRWMPRGTSRVEWVTSHRS